MTVEEMEMIHALIHEAAERIKVLETKVAELKARHDRDYIKLASIMLKLTNTTENAFHEVEQALTHHREEDHR